MDQRHLFIEALPRAQGCLPGQLAGDSLGSLAEFRSQEDIRREDLNGVRDTADGSTRNTWDRYDAAKWFAMRRWLEANPDDELAKDV